MPQYTWTTGEVITAAKLNALESEVWRAGNQMSVGSSTSESSTTSGVYVDAAASVTFTAVATSAFIAGFGGGFFLGSGFTPPKTASIAVNIDGVDYDICHFTSIANVDYNMTFAGGVLVTGLTAGNSYTAKLRIKSGFSGQTVKINADGASRQTIVVFEIQK